MNRLKQLRTEANESQEYVGTIIGVSGQAVGQYELEKRDLSPDKILKLAEHYGCTTDYLLGKTDVRDTGEQIDDVLNEAMIGMSKEEYNALTETQKKQIRDFALFVKNQVDNEK